MTGYLPQVAAVGHYSSGGTELPFIAVTYMGGGGGVDVLLEDSRGGFTLHNYTLGRTTQPEGIIVGHFTNSGVDDLAVADNFGSIYILRGNGDGSFVQVNSSTIHLPTDALPTYLATATIGGAPYLFVSDYASHPNSVTNDNEVLVYKGDGAGNFTLTQRLGDVARPNQIVVAAFNGDGKLDLAVADSYQSGDKSRKTNAVTIFQGDGAGGFSPAQIIHVRLASGLTGPSRPVGLAVGNFAGDNALDLATADYAPGSRGGTVNIIRNISTPGGPIAFDQKHVKSIPLGQHLVNIVAVGLGDARTGLAVTSSGSASRHDHRVFVLHDTGARPGSVAFGRREVYTVGLDPGGMVTAKVTGGNPSANDDLIIVDSGNARVSVLQNLTERS
jgi:hypothetical protein